MRTLKRLLPISLIAGVISPLAFALPARADDFSCSVHGTAATNPPVQLSGGTGTYTSVLDLDCSRDGPPTPAVAEIEVDSSGTYVNIVCGTGSMESTANSARSTFSTDPVLATELTTAIPHSVYHIDSAAGAGVFSWRPPSWIHSVGGGYRGGDGLLWFFPNFDANPAATQCTTHFTVVGSITGEYP
jgi:hypothetical protein